MNLTNFNSPKASRVKESLKSPSKGYFKWFNILNLYLHNSFIGDPASSFCLFSAVLSTHSSFSLILPFSFASLPAQILTLTMRILIPTGFLAPPHLPQMSYLAVCSPFLLPQALPWTWGSLRDWNSILRPAKARTGPLRRPRNLPLSHLNSSRRHHRSHHQSIGFLADLWWLRGSTLVK